MIDSWLPDQFQGVLGFQAECPASEAAPLRYLGRPGCYPPFLSQLRRGPGAAYNHRLLRGHQRVPGRHSLQGGSRERRRGPEHIRALQGWQAGRDHLRLSAVGKGVGGALGRFCTARIRRPAIFLPAPLSATSCRWRTPPAVSMKQSPRCSYIATRALSGRR